MKKFFIIPTIIITVIFIFLYLILFDEKDYCLDTGYCKAGLKLNTEYGLIEINEDNCTKYNWEWDNKNKYCNIKQIEKD
ncbi:MAG: hypothetical protein IJ003_00585 [Candidatus Gastranaerophilales bacterium]|nr:hypothetical protein [Cyanobacteria bacterium SIG27]MBQ8847421.1 hypothetical protein [Candidatus Gastranaerophilales bacterium]